VAILSPATKAIVQDFVTRAQSTNLGYADCVGRAAQILHVIEPTMSSSEVWTLAEELVGERMQTSALSKITIPSTRH
jgi:hypothetical protein